ncbi:DUF4087 domain-containing protein [Amaricoccus sp.]|uniref:DUF4087 domain-containing protein n=1 Tax=Amaricoccus sp. TaxID=1872485 RepID=UPI001B4BF001|nr:DUF4087 domain-containing protein [Amaricoccus sp.]MBP7242587.1 DUF4087 domain-containing protein [Amaricoccus sp.]
MRGLICAALLGTVWLAGPARAETTAPAGPAGENRCGWLVNLTPGDWWLVDRHATWVLSSQGNAEGPAATGLDRLPETRPPDYIEEGSGHGYGCACLNMIVDPATELVKQVLDGRALPLATCQNDRSLPPLSKW